MIGKRLRELRLERKWSMEELGKRVDRNRSTISEIENGKNRPGGKLIEKLSEIFGVTTDYLLGLSDHKELEAYNSKLVNKELEGMMLKIEKMSEERRKMLVDMMNAVIESEKK